MRILYIEDEKYLAEAVKHNLEKVGITVDSAFNGETGLELAVKDIYDCIVLDIMLPKISGTDLLKIIRNKKVKTPVIMLSALSETEDKVHGLNLGADDYLAKPFKNAELIARINAVTRRPALIETQNLKFSDLILDPKNHELNGIKLTAKESNIIQELIKTPEKIVEKSFLLNKIWDDISTAEGNYIEVYISRLRKKIKAAGSQAKIVTRRGFCYKLCS